MSTTNGLAPPAVIAAGYAASGLSVFPIRTDGSKAPACKRWEPYQTRIAKADELARMFRGSVGIAIAGGYGGLEIIDIDNGDLWGDYAALVEAEAPGLLDRLSQVQTPRPGRHLYYRCEQVGVNEKLASDADNQTLIETRARGGYALAPGCPAECHPTGREYLHIAGPPITAAPWITADERAVLFRVARSFNQWIKDEDISCNREAATVGGDRPGDRFNATATWQSILLPHGWVLDHERSGKGYWRRPGKDRGWSATTGCQSKTGRELLCVFSTNAHPFEGAANGRSCSSYDKFSAYTFLNHGGDWKAAARELLGNASTSDPSADRIPSIATARGQTEVANARRLVELHGCDLRWCDPWGKWLTWDGQRWKLDDQRTADAWAKDVGSRLWNDVAEIGRGGGKIDAKMLTFVKSTSGEHGIKATLALARSESGLPILPEILDRDPWLLNVANGTLDLRTGELRGHRREDYVTKLLAVPYDPSAECRIWLAMLDRILAGDVELIGYVQRLGGYCLTGRTTEHILPIPWGNGANGKSTLLGCLLDLMGEYGHRAPSALLLASQNDRHPTEQADLHGKRLVVCLESEDGRRLAESVVKELTGGDKVTARRMKENFWSFHATHKLVLCTNYKPNIRGTDHAIWRRIKLIPFTVKIPDDEQDKDLPDKLKAEHVGILAWLVRGCLAWQREGLGDPPAVRAATADYREAEDTVAQFLDDRCRLAPAWRVRAKVLYAAFVRWSESMHVRPMSQMAFGLGLAERGIERRKSNGWWYHGVCQNEPEDPSGESLEHLEHWNRYPG